MTFWRQWNDQAKLAGGQRSKARKRGQFMADDQMRTDQDVAFARRVADELDSDILTQGFLARPYASQDRDADGLLTLLEERVAQYTNRDGRFLSSEQLATYRKLIRSIQTILMKAGPAGVPMLTGQDNVFALDTIIDILNPRALKALSDLASAGGGDQDSQSPPRFSRAWLRSLQNRGTPVRLAQRNEAATSFLTMFVDTLRSVARSTSRGAPVGANFTVNSLTSGYVLESWPQFNFSPTAFGSGPTSPVSDYLTSGHYRFHGRKNGQLIQDPGVHYAGPTRLSTTMSAF